jgi:hypothetical protein
MLMRMSARLFATGVPPRVSGQALTQPRSSQIAEYLLSFQIRTACGSFRRFSKLNRDIRGHREETLGKALIAYRRSNVLSGDTSRARVGTPASYSFVTISLPSLDPGAGNELAKEPNTIRSGVALSHVRTRVGRDFRVAGTSF